MIACAITVFAVVTLKETNGISLRLVEPAEVGSLVAWLASADAAMVTGSSYGMDGGWSAS